MSNVGKISNAQLTGMSVEDLLSLSGDQINLVTDRPTLPDGFYNFTLVNQEIAEIGKEKNKAIQCSIVITGCNALTNSADQPVVDAVDLATNPVEMQANYSLASNDGFGYRDYMTFTDEIAKRIGALTGADRMEKLNGCTGILHLTVNTYLPNGQPDSPENYRQSNRIKSTETIWN